MRPTDTSPPRAAPFIIHAENEPHQYDDEFTIILGDWYHERGTKLNNKVRPSLAAPLWEVPRSSLTRPRHMHSS